MNDSLRPARAIAPGRIILKEIEARGWNQQDLAAIMGRPEQMISEIIRAKKQITAETARQLGKAFGTSPDFWLNLEMQYQLNQATRENHEKEIERRSTLFNNAPINEMAKRGWIQSGTTTDEMEQAYLSFFGIKSVNQQPQVALLPRVSEIRSPEVRAINAWARRVEQLALEQKVAPFSLESISQVIMQLLDLTWDESGILRIPSLLINKGIHFIIVPHLSKTFLDGAAFWVEGHPVIALTLRYDRIDAFWFTLLHELAHIVLNHSQVHVDQLFGRENEELSQEEIEANGQASEWLLSQDAFDEFIEWNRPRYSRKKIEQFGFEQKRHPGIVIGQLMHRGEIKYSNLREYLVKVKPILKDWIEVSNLE